MTDLMVVSFMSGSGGNMVAAVIDNRGYSFTGWDYVLQENDPRIKWRHGCVEWKLQERDGDIPVMDAAFAEIRQTYHSLCSHIMWYHLRYRHNHVFIDCSSSFAANWCKARLIKHNYLMDDPTTEPDYFMHMSGLIAPIVRKKVTLEDILDGKLITILRQWVHTPLNENVYTEWLNANT